MKIFLWKWESMLIIIGGFVCVSLPINRTARAAANLVPEIAILEHYKQVRTHDDKVEQLFQKATFLDDPQAVHNLLDYLRDDTGVEHGQREGIRLVHGVISHMTCHPEKIIIARIRAEADPWQKVKLMNIVGTFFMKEVFEVLYEQIDDTRMADHPNRYAPETERTGTQFRVCDFVYHSLSAKLERLGYLPPDTPFKDFYRYPYSGRSEEAFAERDRLIEEFKQYWEANQEQIFKELSTRIDALSPTSKKRIRYSQPDAE